MNEYEYEFDDYQEDLACTVEHNLDVEGEYQWLEPCLDLF